MIHKYSYRLFVIILMFCCSRSLRSEFLAGQHFILTLPETYEQKKLSQWLSSTKPAGVMLTSFHVSNREKTKHLTTFLQCEAKRLNIPPLLICIDWEGGLVSRPDEQGGFVSIPSPFLLARGGRSTVFLAGMLIGSQMRDVGINVNFAPSLDLYNPDATILATRCFDTAPEKVAQMGIAFAHGLAMQGVVPVVKHFPGLGLGAADTHEKSVTIKQSCAVFQKHIHPFKVYMQHEKMPFVMATHAIVGQFGNKPMTLSKQGVDGIKQYNKQAFVLTDDFCMKAINKEGLPVDACMQSLSAGYDLIIYSGKASEQIDLIKQLEDRLALASDEQKKSLNQRLELCKMYKNKIAENIDYKGISDEKQLASYIVNCCLHIPSKRPDIKNKKVVLISSDISKIRAARWFVHNKKTYTHKLLQKYGISCHEIIVNPRDENDVGLVKKIIAEYGNQDVIFVMQTLFYADGVWNANQRSFLQQCRAIQDRLVVFSLGHLHEQTIVPSACIVHIGSFHKPLLHRVIRVLCQQQAKTGADSFIDTIQDRIAGKKIGLLCHRSSCVFDTDQGMRFLPDVVHEWTRNRDDGTKLAALFSPEHGLEGNFEAYASIQSSNKSRWDCPIYSLHGKTRKPTKQMLQGLDLVLVDFQDVGMRCFTYLSTLKLVLQAAAESTLPILLLDRPNPLIFYGKAGPMLDRAQESFLGSVFTPFLYGTSIGLLAKAINKTIKADLNVVPCSKANNDYFYDYPFIAPSPNLMSMQHIICYAITVFFEGTNYSEGRGTDYPFMQIGAPWVDGNLLAQTLNAEQLPGIYFEPVTFKPTCMPGIADNPKHKDRLCGGVFLHVYDYTQLNPLDVAHMLLTTICKLYPDSMKWVRSSHRYTIDLLLGNTSWREECDRYLSHTLFKKQS